MNRAQQSPSAKSASVGEGSVQLLSTAVAGRCENRSDPRPAIAGPMSTARMCLVLAVAWLTADISTGQDWPRFRGPNGSGVADATGLPVAFGPATNLLWRTAVPFGRSSPVVAGDRVFLTAAEGDTLLTICLDRASGREVWRRGIVRSRVSPVYKLNDAASPSPVTDGVNVYAFFPDFGLVSFGPDGRERWRLPLGPFDTFYGLGASPILAGDTLLLVCDARTKAFLIAVDSGNGGVRWRVERSEIRFEGHASPVLWEPKGEPAQVIVLGVNRLDAYAVATGERLWWIRGLAFLPVASPVVDQGLVVVSTWGSESPSGPSFQEFLKSDSNRDGRLSRDEVKDFDEFGAVDKDGDGFIYEREWEELRKMGVGDYGMIAVRLGGRGDLTDTGVVWRDKKNYSTLPTSLIYKDVLYVPKGGGIIASLDPQTGQVFKIDRTKDALGDYYASPVAADDKVFFVSDSGKVTVVSAGRQWEILAVNDLGEETYATPAIAGRRLFIRTRHALYCFGAKPELARGLH
jgi:outer membrane protein assembly factor BamB